MTEPKFGELPPSAARKNLFDSIAAALQRRKGEWALIATYSRQGTASSLVGRINRGVGPMWEPRGAFEATSRNCDVWARYVGTEATR